MNTALFESIPGFRQKFRGMCFEYNFSKASCGLLTGHLALQYMLAGCSCPDVCLVSSCGAGYSRRAARPDVIGQFFPDKITPVSSKSNSGAMCLGWIADVMHSPSLADPMWSKVYQCVCAQDKPLVCFAQNTSMCRSATQGTHTNKFPDIFVQFQRPCKRKNLQSAVTDHIYYRRKTVLLLFSLSGT